MNFAISIAALVLSPGRIDAFVSSIPSLNTRHLQSNPLLATMTEPEKTTTSDAVSQAASQNSLGVASDAVSGLIFSFLHAFDDCGIEDSSKNLRVLWVRALMAHRGMIKDDVAATLLPKSTRALVTSDAGSRLFNPIIQFTEWIQARTDFIDGSLDAYLSSPVCFDDKSKESLPCNVVLIGAGYDTRALRYRHANDHKINMMEVDLPKVTEGKRRLYKQFQEREDPDWDVENGVTLVPFDLNDCGGSVPKSLVKSLYENGLKKDVPTFFLFEAVLFYVNEDAIRNIFDELSAFAQPGGNGENEKAETLICFTDSLKPFVDVPFTSETTTFFNRFNLDLLNHRSRWGGVVHFALASTFGISTTEGTRTKHQKRPKGLIGQYVAEKVGGLVSSYTPTQSNNPDILHEPSFENTWYAVAYPWQIDGHKSAFEASLNENKEPNKKPFATRLWGEPLVIYRDSADEISCMVDVCPHRSAPLSMGTVEDGELVCFYHGWRYGSKGECTDVPTLRAVSPINESKNDRFKEKVNTCNQSNNRAVIEHEGMIWVWRGELLSADVSKLPTKRKGDMDTLPFDTVLDYDVDYSYIVENNLDSPHLFYLHDGSVPPIESIGMMAKNLDQLRLSSFQDDCGFGHLGKLGDKGRVKKLIRFDPPNIVRHGGVSGFEEEFHIVPIAPHRTRVLLRQHIPKGPILTTVSSIPGLTPVLKALVSDWNYHIALEDASVMKGQSHVIESMGAPRMGMASLGDDLIRGYWTWRGKAHRALGDNTNPYFGRFEESSKKVAIPTGTSIYGDNKIVVNDKIRSGADLGLEQGKPQVDEKTGEEVGTWGIKQNFIQNTPAADFPPMNYKAYKERLFLHDFANRLMLGEEPSSTMIKTAMGDTGGKVDEMERFRKGKLGPTTPRDEIARTGTAAGAVFATAGLVFAMTKNVALANAFVAVLANNFYIDWISRGS